MGCVESADSGSSRRRRQDDAAPTDPRRTVSEAPCAAASNPLVAPPPCVSGISGSGEAGPSPRDEAGSSSLLVFTPVAGPGQPFTSDQPQIEVGPVGDADDGGGGDDVDYVKRQASRAGAGGSMDGGSTSSSRRQMSRRSSQLLLFDSSARMSGRSASMQGSPGTSTVAATLQRLHEQVARGSTDSGADPVLNWMQGLADRSLDSTATSLRGAFHFASSMSLAGSVSGGRSSSRRPIGRRNSLPSTTHHGPSFARTYDQSSGAYRSDRRTHRQRKHQLRRGVR